MAENSIKILVVDDEEKIVQVVKSYLENAGFIVCFAYNGSEAIKCFERFNPSLIILDLMLPDISGEDICRAIRRKSRVPIIMLTAKVEEENILKGLDIGADDYVTKPFSPRQLVARVRALLRRSTEEIGPLSNIISFYNDDLKLNVLNHEVSKQGRALNLTPNEVLENN